MAGMGKQQLKARMTRIWSVVALWAVLVGYALAGGPYSIQVGAYATVDEAQAAQARYETTHSPTFVVETDDTDTPYALAVGRFDYRSEAWVASTRLTSDNCAKCRVLPMESAPEAATSTEANSLPLNAPLDSAGLEGLASIDPESHWTSLGLAEQPEPDSVLLAKSPDSMTRAELLQVGLAASERTVAKPALERFLAVYPSDADSNSVRLRLARLTGCDGTDDAYTLLATIRATGSAEEKPLADLIEAYMKTCRGDRVGAMALFQSLANDTALAPSLRIEAMQRYARHAHAMRDYPSAWLAFDAIEKSDPDPAVAADARLEKAGIAFELTGCAKGDWQETQALCDSVASIPGATRKTKATAALIGIEAKYYQDRKNEALVELEAYLVEYDDIPREFYTALNWKGIVLCDLRDYNQAEAVFQQLLECDIPAGEKFGGKEPKAMAARWLAWLAERKGDAQGAISYLRFTAENYSDHPLGQYAERKLKNSLYLTGK